MGRTLRHGRGRGASLRYPCRRVQAWRLDEVVEDGVTGFLVPPDDVQAATDAVGKAAGISRLACREHAVNHLDLDRSLDVTAAVPADGRGLRVDG